MEQHILDYIILMKNIKSSSHKELLGMKLLPI